MYAWDYDYLLHSTEFLKQFCPCFIYRLHFRRPLVSEIHVSFIFLRFYYLASQFMLRIVMWLINCMVLLKSCLFNSYIVGYSTVNVNVVYFNATLLMCAIWVN